MIRDYNHSLLQGFRVPTGVKEHLLKTALGRWCQGMHALSPSGLSPARPSKMQLILSRMPQWRAGEKPRPWSKSLRTDS